MSSWGTGAPPTLAPGLSHFLSFCQSPPSPSAPPGVSLSDLPHRAEEGSHLLQRGQPMHQIPKVQDECGGTGQQVTPGTGGDHRRTSDNRHTNTAEGNPQPPWGPIRCHHSLFLWPLLLGASPLQPVSDQGTTGSPRLKTTPVSFVSGLGPVGVTESSLVECIFLYRKKKKENTGCTKKKKVVLNPHMGHKDT